jgi:hypothetical protein
MQYQYTYKAYTQRWLCEGGFLASKSQAYAPLAGPKGLGLYIPDIII